MFSKLNCRPCLPVATPLQVAALLVLYVLSAAALLAVRPFNSAALGALELVATLAPLASFAGTLAVMGSRGASGSTRQAGPLGAVFAPPCGALSGSTALPSPPLRAQQVGFVALVAVIRGGRCWCCSAARPAGAEAGEAGKAVRPAVRRPA